MRGVMINCVKRGLIVGRVIGVDGGVGTALKTAVVAAADSELNLMPGGDDLAGVPQVNLKKSWLSGGEQVLFGKSLMEAGAQNAVLHQHGSAIGVDIA